MNYKIFLPWVFLFITEVITVSLQVYYEIQSFQWLARACEGSATMRANIKTECGQAMEKSKYGAFHYALNEITYRVNYCGRYSCMYLYKQATYDIWSFLKALGLASLSFYAGWEFVYKTVQKKIQVRKINKLNKAFLPVEDVLNVD